MKYMILFYIANFNLSFTVHPFILYTVRHACMHEIPAMGILFRGNYKIDFINGMAIIFWGISNFTSGEDIYFFIYFECQYLFHL